MNVIFDMWLGILKENFTTTFKIHLIEAQLPLWFDTHHYGLKKIHVQTLL